MSSFYQKNCTIIYNGIIVLIAVVFSFCAKEQPTHPFTAWQNTFTPYLENNNQRDTVFDDENITFSTDNTPSDRYIWSWGDGSKNDTTQTIYAIHQFKRIGLNIVTLRVERGKTYGEKSLSIYVKHHNVPNCGFRIDCDDSLYVQNVSHFVANINTPNCQSTCSFDYQWDFGDGSTGVGYHTTHSFDKTGTYLVKVKISRCSGPDTMLQKQIFVSGSSNTVLYNCKCINIAGGNSFLDTIPIQNLPYNPIKVDGRVLRRSGNANHYYGEYNCNPNGCDSYILDAFNNLDSIHYRIKLPPFVEYTCSGRRL
jgi:hypothetical protein